MSSSTKIQDVQEQLDEVVLIAKTNVGKLLERDSRLTDLQTKSEDLEAQSKSFSRNATSFKRALWWKNTKLTMMIACICLIILAIIITSIALSNRN